jgi:ferric-dicitrate binding protein FerR (iron transport regulator)
MQGRIDDRTRAEMDAHADGCTRCAAARGRVLGTIERTFPAIRKESAPDLAWDSIRAKAHWEFSSSKRKKLAPPRRKLVWLGLGLGTAAAAAVGALVAFGGHPDEAKPTAPVAIAPAPASLVGQVSRVSGEVMIDGIRQADVLDHQVGEGTLLATRDGRVDVQFGDASALSVGPRTRLELRHFDAKQIELVVDGTVDVEVSARAQGQQFVVQAGEQTIEVRGTQFRVRRDSSGTHVACRHGLVAVRDAHGELQVGAEKRIDIATSVAGEHVVAMTPAELAELAAATPVATLAKDTVPLELTSNVQRPVRLDGVELGDAPMRVRVTPGRHLVEAADRGRYHRVQWVTVEPSTPATVRVELPVEAAPAPKADERRRQFLAGIDRARLGRCTRAITKDDITGLSVQIEIGVDAAGAVNFLNVLDSGDLDTQTTSCVREVLADVRFGAGDAATWRERIGL